MYFCVGVNPGPPCSVGQPGTDQPLCFPSILCQAVTSSLVSSCPVLVFFDFLLFLTLLPDEPEELDNLYVFLASTKAS